MCSRLAQSRTLQLFMTIAAQHDEHFGMTNISAWPTFQHGQHLGMANISGWPTSRHAAQCCCTMIDE